MDNRISIYTNSPIPNTWIGKNTQWNYLLNNNLMQQSCYSVPDSSSTNQKILDKFLNMKILFLIWNVLYVYY
jgi:hypothetical protein